MADRVAVESLAPGDSIKGGIYRLKSAEKSPQGGYSIILSDKSGEVAGEISAERWVKEYSDLVGGAVTLNAVVYVGNDNGPYIKVKSLASAPEGTYKPSELFDGLSPEKIKEYEATIKGLTNRIPSKAMRDLVGTILTEDTLGKLATLPASLAYHGKYLGGALAATAAVASLTTKEAVAYVKVENGLYSLNFDWSTLCAAALLHTAALPDFYTATQPFKMTEKGLQRGYMSLLQEKIQKAIVGKKIPVTDEQVSKLLNVLECSVPMKSGVKATCPEGKVLRSVLMFYEEMDQTAAALSEHEFEEGENYAYLKKLGYMTARQGEEADAA